MIKYLLTFGLFSSSLCTFGFDDVHGSTLPASDSNPVALEIDGAKITLADFEQKQPLSLFQARNNFYQTENKALDAFVNDYLLERQAQKEHVTVNELLQRHVNSVVDPDPSEDALRLYYEGIEAKEPYEKMRAGILDHIRQTRIAKAKAEYIQGLRNEAKISFRLPPPRTTVSLKDTPVRGAAKPAVTIVEFADFECPYCQNVQPVLDKVEADYKDKVAFAYKDVPLPMHPHALKAAEAAHCAGAQGKYWEYHDLLFASKQLEVDQLKEAARTLKLDTKVFDQCLDSGAQSAVVQVHSAEGQALQIQGTPSFLINGRFFSGGFTYEGIKSILDEEIATSSTQRTQSATR
jgi:protein-disulfide isomerase